MVDFRSKLHFGPTPPDYVRYEQIDYTAYWNSFVKEFKSPKRLTSWYIYLLLKHSINIDYQLVLQRASERTTFKVRNENVSIFN